MFEMSSDLASGKSGKFLLLVNSWQVTWMNVADHLCSADLHSGSLSDLQRFTLTLAHGHSLAINKSAVAGSEVRQEVFVISERRRQEKECLSIFFNEFPVFT